MSERDPNNSGRWADGTTRSQGNAFDVAYTPDPEARRWTRKLQQQHGLSVNSTKTVSKARVGGRDPNAIKGLSRKADEMVRKFSIQIENQAKGQASTEKRARLRRGTL